jgi:hypothetical protein
MCYEDVWIVEHGCDLNICSDLLQRVPHGVQLRLAT